VTKYLISSTYKEKRLILAHGSRDFSPWPAAFAPMVRQSTMTKAHILAAKKQRERRKGPGSPKAYPSD
jgi:hypothetical protein